MEKKLSEKLYERLNNITDKEKYKLIILTVGNDAAITPVPCGVGPMALYSLIENTLC